jgi:hypothetical protein
VMSYVASSSVEDGVRFAFREALTWRPAQDVIWLGDEI